MEQILLSSAECSQRENDKLKIVKSQLKSHSKTQRLSLSVLQEILTSCSYRVQFLMLLKIKHKILMCGFS